MSTGDQEPELGGFSFETLSQQPVASKLLRAHGPEQPETRVFEVAADGAFHIEGYTPEEIKELLLIYREHMSDFAREAQLIQASQDASRQWPASRDI